MKLIDQMQPLVGEDFDLTELIWDVIEDVLHSIALAGLAEGANPDTIYGTVLDYVTNHYGE